MITRTRRMTAASAVFAAALAMPAVGWAQTQQGPVSPIPAQSNPGQTPAGMSPQAVPSTQAAMPPAQHTAAMTGLEKGVEQHINQLHSQLKITAAQQPQWDQFAQVMRDNARAMSESIDQRAQQVGTMNAVDSMNSFAQISEQRSADLGKLATAFQTLYGSFSDQQKQAADQLFRRQAEAHDARAEKHMTHAG